MILYRSLRMDAKYPRLLIAEPSSSLQSSFVENVIHRD
jgi:hypothetical protein